LGLFLFAVPSVKSSYWTAFFPAFVVLGLGMAVSVAPLTTVVMGSVENDRAGTASGINNAIARLAGVLAIAILGNVMVPAFRSNLERSIGSLGLPPAVMRDIQANSVNVGNLTVPAGLDVATAAAVRADIARAFVFGFRCVMLISGCLAIAAAVVALILIPSKERSA
jgi:predicted MFS family arabinose efflux permease